MDSSGSIWLPPAGSTTAGEVDPIFHFILYTSIILFVIVVGLLVYFSWRFRRRGKPGLISAPTHNTTLEIIWTGIPIVLVLVVFVWGLRLYIQEHVAPANSIEIKVTGQQWFWSFEYPSGTTSMNELVVPLGRPIKLLMSSKDVIHGFYVPDFRIKQDVLPNRYTVAWFQATEMGEHNLFCTTFCGTGHSQMLAKVKVVSDKEYDDFLQSSSSGLPSGMTPEEYGEQLYKTKACVTCHSIDGSTGVGPSWKGIWGKMELMSDGKRVLVDENYVRESILEPRAKIVNGFQPVMPTYQGILKDQQIDAIIAYIKSLK
jgi:cytochrome c oxidase subunit 2